MISTLSFLGDGRFFLSLSAVALMLAGLFALLWEFWRRSKVFASIILVDFLVQISSSASISVKSFVFNQFAILLLVVFDARAARA